MEKTDAGVETLLSWAEKFRSVLELADQLKSLSSMEQATKERKSALDAAITEHEGVKSQVSAAKAELVELKVAQTRAIEEHAAGMSAKVSEAEDRAAALIATAQKQAERIVADANAEAERREAAANEALKASTDELAKVKAQLADATKAHAEKKKEHQDFSDRIAAMKKAAASVLQPTT